MQKGEERGKYAGVKCKYPGCNNRARNNGYCIACYRRIYDEKKRKTKVYVSMVADFWHAGHDNIIRQARRHGKVIVGLLTDEATATYKRVPVQSYKNREKVVKNIKGVWKVIPQTTLDYRPNLRKIKPHFVVNGDDWRTGVQKETRKQVINELKKWGGKLIEVPYTKGISSTLIIEDYRKNGVTPEQRMNMLRRLINIKPLVRVIEAHNGISAMVVENTKVEGKNFDAIWESSFTDSASKGKPDIELVSMDSRIDTINEILEVSTKPIIVDADTGGQIQHFEYMVRTMERLGVSAVIIEDKVFPKVNSLMPNAKHQQETINKFCTKIKAGKKAQITGDFMIFARIESYIAGKDTNDAIKRAKQYIKAGADGIMIHSKKEEPDEIIDFCIEYKKLKNKVPLIAVPTTYNSILEKDLRKLGIDIVIYANHLLRSSYKAMQQTAERILLYERAQGVNDDCCSVKDLFELTRRK